MCVCGVSVTAWNLIHSFPSINNSVSATDMLASLNGNEEMGVKKEEAFCPSHNFLLALLRLFFCFCFINSVLEGYARSECSFFSWWQRECLSEIQLLLDSTGSFVLVQIKKRDRVKNEWFRKERCEVSSGWQLCFEVRLSAEGWVCLGGDVLQLFVWIKGPWASNAWETQEENISRDGTVRWTWSYRILSLRLKPVFSVLSTDRYFENKVKGKTCCENIMMQLHKKTYTL